MKNWVYVFMATAVVSSCGGYVEDFEDFGQTAEHEELGQTAEDFEDFGQTAEYEELGQAEQALGSAAFGCPIVEVVSEELSGGTRLRASSRTLNASFGRQALRTICSRLDSPPTFNTIATQNLRPTERPVLTGSVREISIEGDIRACSTVNNSEGNPVIVCRTTRGITRTVGCSLNFSVIADDGWNSGTSEQASGTISDINVVGSKLTYSCNYSNLLSGARISRPRPFDIILAQDGAFFSSSSMNASELRSACVNICSTKFPIDAVLDARDCRFGGCESIGDTINTCRDRCVANKGAPL